jgi:hypothetical protein
MIDVNTETVRRLVALAREIQGQDAIARPDETATMGVEWDGERVDSQEQDLSSAEFRCIVEDLEPDQQQQVVALMWLGRGDYLPEEWEDAVALAEEQWTEETASYLLAHPMLADELSAALVALGYDD